jgi:transposase
VQSYEPGEAPDPDRVAGVDLGIIHPFAVVSDKGSLLVSGRALRAESRLHLAESKARRRAVARRAPSKGQRGSRRWRKYRARTRVLEGRHNRRLAQSRHEAASAVIDFARENRIGLLVVGDPRGVLGKDSGAPPEPGHPQLAGRTPDRCLTRQSSSRWHRGGDRRRAWHLFYLPKM